MVTEIASVFDFWMSRASFKDFLRAAWMGRTELSRGIIVPIKIA
jgi:hypothetical protein